MYSTLERCPGLYCGRTLTVNGTWSDCGACERGFRVNKSFACSVCLDELSTYSWLYLGFMCLLPLMLHCFFIDLDAKDRKFSRKQIIFTFCAIIEVTFSAIFSILLMEPKWELNLNSCGVQKFTDWYTLFYNPNPNYENRLHCTQEAVYPLQTIVLVFYFFCFLTMFCLRPIVCVVLDVRGKTPIYAALYFLPLLIFTHALACGLIYYSFPYLSIAISMVTNAVHYSLKLDQSIKSLMRSSIMEMKNFVVIAIHWLFLAYGIISLGHSYVFLCLVPFPSLFYILTVKFTDPAKFREIETHAN